MRVRYIIIGALIIALNSCATLPRSGPAHQAIDAHASAKLVSADKTSGIDYVLVDIVKNVVSHYDESIIQSLEVGFGVGRSSAPEVQLGVGDVVEISIFEAQAGGLFIPDDAGSRPGNYITVQRRYSPDSAAL